MNKAIKERISALLDGELSDFEVRRVLDEIEANAELREYWSNLQITKTGLRDKSLAFIDKDISTEVFRELKGKSLHDLPKKNKKTTPIRLNFIVYAVSLGLVVSLSAFFFIPSKEVIYSDSFSNQASEKIAKAIASEEALSVLNKAVTGLNAKLEKIDSDITGNVLANYRMSSNGKSFNVSLSPISSTKNLNTLRPSKITYLKTDKGIFVLMVSGDIPSEKKTQILRNVNINFNNTK